VQTKRYADAYPLLKGVVESPHVDPRTKDAFIQQLGQIAIQLKQYPEAIEWLQKSIAAGHDTTDARYLIGVSYYAQNKFKECASTTHDVLERSEREGKRPSENLLQMLFQCQSKMDDAVGQGRTIERLVTYYPKPDYWQNAMITLIKSARNDERLLLQVYRLQADVGTLKRSDQFGEMAQLSIEQGYPGEAVSILEQALGKIVFTEEREKAKYVRLLEASKKALAQEKDGIAAAEKEALRTGNGDLLVAVGGNYLFNAGDAAKAVSLIQQGIAKGLTKVPLYDAYITLGLAQAKAKNGADADKAFAKVDKNDNYERLAKLWSLRVK
jgi:tetratricopeptide (TPR) repeat protein